MLVAAVLLAAPALFLPAHTAYILEPKDLDRAESGPLEVVAGKTKLLWGGYLASTGALTISVEAEPGAETVRYQIEALGPGLRARKQAKPGEPAGFAVSQTGWYRFFLTAQGPTSRVLGLNLGGPAVEGAKFNLKTRRNCASVHIGYPLPPETQVDWFYNEIRAKTDPIHTYFMACGFSRGYFGMQVNGPSERRIIFSIWDSGDEAIDREKVGEDDRVKLMAKGEGVYAGDFGNEGTGGHSHLKTMWRTRDPQRFLVRAERDGTHTTYTGYWYSNEAKRWTLIASFRAPKDGGLLRGLYSFNENFWGDNGHLLRAAEFGPAWVRTVAGEWKQLTDGRFTYDGTGGKDRFDYDLKAIGGRWRLQNGGFEGASPALRTIVPVPPAARPPRIDLAALPTK